MKLCDKTERAIYNIGIRKLKRFLCTHIQMKLSEASVSKNSTHAAHISTYTIGVSGYTVSHTVLMHVYTF